METLKLSLISEILISLIGLTVHTLLNIMNYIELIFICVHYTLFNSYRKLNFSSSIWKEREKMINLIIVYDRDKPHMIVYDRYG